MVSSISSLKNTNSSVSLGNTKSKTNEDNEIKSLQSQENDLKKQLQAVRSSNVDSNTKQISIKSLENQIQEVDSQIQQVQLNNSIATNNSNNSNNNNNSSTGNSKSSDESALVSSSVLYKQMDISNAMRKSFKGKSAELRSDATLDEGSGDEKGAQAENNEANKDDAIANALNGRIAKLSNSITKAYQNDNSNSSKVQTPKSNKDKTSTDDIDSKLDKNILKTSEPKNNKNVKDDSDKATYIDVSA